MSTTSNEAAASVPQSDNVAHATAGAGGGILAQALTYPLVTLSTRAQIESRKSDATFVKAVQRIIHREGIAGLYSGLDSALFGIGVTNFIYYYWYEWTRTFFETAAVKAGRLSKKLTTGESMAAGAVAGSLTVLITNPIWVVNTRMTAGQGEQGLATEKPSAPKGTLATFFSILKDEGLSGIFAGVVPALILVINPILQYTIFEKLKEAVEKRRRITPTDAFYLGALGKLAATSITYPYITIKSRMHVAGKHGPRENMISSLRKIIKEEGVGGLYGGIGSKIIQSVLTAAFLFAFKDALYGYSLKLRRTVAKN